MKHYVIFVAGVLLGALGISLYRQGGHPGRKEADVEARLGRLEKLLVSSARSLASMQADLSLGVSSLSRGGVATPHAPVSPVLPSSFVSPLKIPPPPPPPTPAPPTRGLSECGSDPKCIIDALDPSRMSFVEFASKVPWHKVATSHKLSTKLKDKLLYWTERPPPSSTEFPKECAPAPPKPTAAQCKDTLPGVFLGVRDQPRKMVAGLVFGWELDLLEMQMANLENVVDYYAVFENSWSHGKTRHVKPLLWDRNKNTPRFARFADRTFHAAIGVEEGKRFMEQRQREPGAAFEWASEDIQERAGWNKIKAQMAAKGLVWEWTSGVPSSTPGVPARDGLEVGVVFGDTDEMADAEAVNMLRWCSIRRDALGTGVAFASWFVLGRLDVGMSFPTDFPFRARQAAGLSYAFGNPGFTNPASQPRPGRPWAGSPHALLGGVHLSHYPYLPFIMLKCLSGTHNTGLLPDWMIHDLASDVHRLQGYSMNLTGGFRRWYTKSMVPGWGLIRHDHRYARVVNNTVIRMLKCAENRYPTLWGRWDPRLN
eukprot:Hpha_TRINITY_DN26563_c0_g1::TRINITY_DN26563_c0_g1_i1::g.112876::m.112876